MRKHLLVLLTFYVSLPLLAPRRSAAQPCVCRIEGASVNVANLPDIQKVAVTKALEPLDVRISDLSTTQNFVVEIGTAQKLPLGPFAIEAMHHLSVQASQTFPKTGAPVPVTVRWYVRFHTDDAFFDPCLREPAVPACTTGFPPAGAKLRLLMPASLSDRLEEFYIATIPVTIATLDLLGTEGLLVIDNVNSGPRTLRVQVKLDR